MELSGPVSGRIFDIQGFSVHDGPGARSLIFLMGCTLRCSWCSNPEGLTPWPVPLHYVSRCIGCGNCAAACTREAISMINNLPVIDRKKCEDCNDPACERDCYTEALRVTGRMITVEELFTIIRRDRQFWGQGGGITLTGGEPLLQADFAAAILEKCYHAYIHTAIETCGQVPWTNFEMTIPFIDWIFFDLKHIDPVQHKKGTGSGNTAVLANLKKLNKSFTGRLVFRMPFVPGYNDTEENLEGIAEMIAGTRWKEIHLMPLHHLGREKYPLVGKKYKAGVFPAPESGQLHEAQNLFERHGITCYAGHEIVY